MTRFVTITTTLRPVSIKPNWCGKGLAIHYKVQIIDDEPEFVKARKHWAITDIASGQRAGPYFRGSLKQAISFAREWDALFAGLTDEQRSLIATGKHPQWVKDYMRDLCAIEDRYEKGLK
ncbi:MAG: hypothetical protein FJ083_14550 [Cyanobacteria bacterium K_Offshore_surface_m2_239]|nr:hypothetical protein [Cyanobacteria bacterium K_Offshore_surface_m2_239]